jgi:hypothetical protein
LHGAPPPQLTGEADEQLLGEVRNPAAAWNIRPPSTATFTSVAATTVAAVRKVGEGEPRSRARAHPRHLFPVVVHRRLALEDDEQGVAGLTLADEVHPGRQIGGLGVASDRLALALGALREEPDIGQEVG